jgi:hypothetical protein
MPVFLDQAKAHLESGLYFDPPHDRCFRLDQSAHAGVLFKSLGVQEMDFGWWDEAKQAMRLLEVKDYSRPESKFNHELFLNECLQKATDCLLLLASIWYTLPCAHQARDSVPEEWYTRPAAPPRLDMFFVVKVAESGRGEAVGDPLGLEQLQARARNKMRGRLELLGVRPATMLFVMDHRTAATRVPIRTDEALVGPHRRGRR